MSNDSELKAQIYLTIGFFAGIYLFFRGFKRFRQKRLIENIPTSTIRAAAMGLVELTGTVSIDHPMISPLTQTKCVYYKYTVEEHRRSGKHSRWVTIASGDSNNCSFWLKDETGQIVVFPQGAEFYLPLDYEYYNNRGMGTPQNIEYFSSKYSMSLSGLMFRRSLRFREWHIADGQEIYVMGTCKDNREQKGFNVRKVLAERLETLKRDSKKMAEIDANKDGDISAEEWQAAVYRVEQGILEDQMNNLETESVLDVIIAKGDVQKFFMISDHSQKEITGKLNWEAFGGVFGGAALTVFCLWMLLSMYQIL